MEGGSLPGQGHYIVFVLKMARRSKTTYGKVRFCAAAKAANVYNYKHKTHVAGEPAVPISRFYDWEPFFRQKKL